MAFAGFTFQNVGPDGAQKWMRKARGYITDAAIHASGLEGLRRIAGDFPGEFAGNKYQENIAFVNGADNGGGSLGLTTYGQGDVGYNNTIEIELRKRWITIMAEGDAFKFLTGDGKWTPRSGELNPLEKAMKDAKDFAGHCLAVEHVNAYGVYAMVASANPSTKVVTCWAAGYKPDTKGVPSGVKNLVAMRGKRVYFYPNQTSTSPRLTSAGERQPSKILGVNVKDGTFKVDYLPPGVADGDCVRFYNSINANGQKAFSYSIPEIISAQFAPVFEGLDVNDPNFLYADLWDGIYESASAPRAVNASTVPNDILYMRTAGVKIDRPLIFMSDRMDQQYFENMAERVRWLDEAMTKKNFPTIGYKRPAFIVPGIGDGMLLARDLEQIPDDTMYVLSNDNNGNGSIPSIFFFMPPFKPVLEEQGVPKVQRVGRTNEFALDLETYLMMGTTLRRVNGMFDKYQHNGFGYKGA